MPVGALSWRPLISDGPGASAGSALVSSGWAEFLHLVWLPLAIDSSDPKPPVSGLFILYL